MTVRVRFSPAPTGYLHVGGARSALFNWLYARNRGGTFILRIEDTDADRSQPHLIEAIHDSLRWLGIDWDEEVRQSDRFDDYRALAADFIERDLAYYCSCTREDLVARVGENAGYDGHCRSAGLTAGEGRAIRFRTPDTGSVGWDDLVRDRVDFENDVLEDFIIVRSNGVPMFHLANAYDDAEMKISHVVRGEDLVNTTPRVLLLMAAMGVTEPPTYAHLPLIVNEQRKKLSKRRDDVAVGDYREKGYLPEAMRNYLVTLGWGAKDDIEIRPIEEIVDRFDLADINKAPAFFDVKKLDHFNGEYIRMMSVDDFVDASFPFVAEQFGDAGSQPDREVYRRLAPFVQERVSKFEESPRFVDWVLGDPPEPEEKDWRKVMTKDHVPPVLDAVIERLPGTAWEPKALEELVLGVGQELEVKSQLPVRLALTGRRSGVPLFEPMVELSREVVSARLEQARGRL